MVHKSLTFFFFFNWWNVTSIHRIHQPMVYFVKAYDDKADDKAIGKRPIVEMQ